MTDNHSEINKEYLIFEVANIMFATEIIDILEIIDPPEIEKIPNAKKLFLGVMNYRGKIAGVIDLSKKTTNKHTDYSKSKVLILETENGIYGCTVDLLHSVKTLDNKSINTDPPVKTSVNKEFLIGIFNNGEGEIISIINLKKLLSNEELLNLSKITGIKNLNQKKDLQ